MAPAGHVHDDVQRAVADMPQMALQIGAVNSSPSAVWVSFQVDFMPGVRQEEGAGRAKSVVLAQSCRGLHAHERTTATESSSRAAAGQVLEVSDFMQAVVSEWQALCRAQLVQKMRDSFRMLRRRAERALAAEDGDELVQVVLRSVAGLCVMESYRQTPPDHVLAPSFLQVVGLLAERLLRLVNLTSSRLDMRHLATRRRMKPALHLCRKLAEQHDRPLPESWLKLQKWSNSRLQRLCNVDGCHGLAAGALWRSDSLGLAGPRCTRHGARRCNVESCKRFARSVIQAADDLGLAGRRCELHAGKPKWCIAEGCGRWPAGFVSKTDQHGPPGPRCLLHGAGCTAPGCRNHTWGRVERADRYGQPGRRCWLHGGKTCAVAGCKNPPRRRLQEADGFGPPGIRCDDHSYRSSARLGPKTTNPASVVQRAGVPKQVTNGQQQKVRVAKPTGELAGHRRCRLSDGKGYHCSRPAKEGHSLCEHHWSLRQQWPSKQLRRKREQSKKKTRLASCMRKFGLCCVRFTSYTYTLMQALRNNNNNFPQPHVCRLECTSS